MSLLVSVFYVNAKGCNSHSTEINAAKYRFFLLKVVFFCVEAHDIQNYCITLHIDIFQDIGD